jgi:polyisoprenoid-binding protein YceI
MNKTRIALGILTASIATVSLALAASRSFVVPTDSKFDAQKVFTIENQTDIENFTARTNKISGNVEFDPEAKTGSAELTIDGASIDTGVILRNEHMRSADWFNFDKNSEIKFVTTSVKNAGGDNYRVTGKLTLNGITKSISTKSATVRFTKANEVTKGIGYAGDVVAIVAKFKLNITDFGAKHPAITAGRVAKELDATIKFVSSAQ